MQQSKCVQESKELITVKKLEISRLQKELCKLETAQREELTRRYCSE